MEIIMKNNKILITKEEYDEYIELKEKNTPMRKVRFGYTSKKHCPICNYVVDDRVPTQKYCDRCGQRLVENFEIVKNIKGVRNILYTPDMNVRCERCGCKFSFSKDNVHMETSYRKNGTMKSYYVLCPICDKKIYVFNK